MQHKAQIIRRDMYKWKWYTTYSSQGQYRLREGQVQYHLKDQNQLVKLINKKTKHCT